MKRYLIFLQLFVCILFAGRVAICLDPGHGGTEPGTVNPRYGGNGPYEKDFNLYIAQVMADDLYWGLGYTVCRHPSSLRMI